MNRCILSFVRMIIPLSVIVGSAFPPSICCSQDSELEQPKQIAGNEIKPAKTKEEQEYETKAGQLIDLLENGTQQERDDSERLLLELGPAILSLLPQFPSSNKSAFRSAIDRIRDQMQSKAIGEYAKPSTITLNGTLPAADILLEIMDQTGNELTVAQLDETEIEIDYEETPFWEALDEVLDDVGLDIEQASEEGKLSLTSRRPGRSSRAGRASYAGVFRMEPTRVESVRSFESSAQDHLTIYLQVEWEPRLKPVFFQFPMRDILVECDNGDILQAATPEASPEYTPSQSNRIESDLDVRLPQRDAKKIKRLSGSLVAAIPGAPVNLEFDELDQEGKKTQEVGKLNVSVDQVLKVDNEKIVNDDEDRQNTNATSGDKSDAKAEETESLVIYQVKLLINLRDAGETMDSFRGWLMTNEAHLIDRKGQKLNNISWNTYLMNSKEVGICYFFEVDSNIVGHRLIYTAPGAVTNQRIDFIIKDIMLP